MTGDGGRGPGGRDGPRRPEAVFFLTHVLHPDVLGRFEALRAQTPDACDLFFLLDTGSLPPDGLEAARRTAGDTLLTFDFEEVARSAAGYPRPWAEEDPTGLVPGNIDLLWIHLRSRVGPYVRYWFVEHDVAYTGRWGTLFEHFRDDDADLLGTTIHPRETLPGFHWWDGFSAPGASSGELLLRGFFPVVRVTDEALEALDDVYRAGWSGHFEVVVPTAMARLGLDIGDLGGTGPYVAEENRGRFYTNTPTRTSLAPGTFVYKPTRRFPGLRRQMLWHPVKPTAGRISPYLDMAREWFRMVRERRSG